MPKHAPPRQMLSSTTANGRKCEVSDCNRDSEDESPLLLPHLGSAAKRLNNGHGDSHMAREPRWMATKQGGGLPVKKAARKGGDAGRRKPHIATSEAPHKLSLLDEQMLVLCRSAIERSWARQQQQLPPKKAHRHESIYAATQVQRLFRGFKMRRRLAESDGPRYQRAASHIQFALRRVLVVRRAFKRWMDKRHRCATRIQAWYRGCRCRDLLQYERARFVVEHVRLLQRRYRGYRFWNLVSALLARRTKNAATQVQRCYRGLVARRRVQQLRRERLRFAQELKRSSELHRYQSRCDGCRPDRCTEESLFACFMVRFVGLHDFAGAKTLGMEGIRAYPASARFSFMYSVLLQATGENLDVSMAFLRRAQVALKLNEDEITECEVRFLLPALQLCKDDIAVLLELAIISQCLEKITRAEAFYRLALSQAPRDYAIPGYWHRVDMVDRLLLSYHRFCSVFKSRQVNVLSKVVPIAKRGEQLRVMVARLNRFTVIFPADEANVCRFNAVYLSEEEVAELLVEKPSSDDDEPAAMPAKLTHFESLIRRKSSRKESRRTSTRPGRSSTETVAKAQVQEARKNVICQLYQSEFRGLEFKPTELSRLSEPRSRLTVTREQAEKLVRELTFVDPQIDSGQETTGERGFLFRVVLIPSLLKNRMLRVQQVRFSHAIVHAQRIFRGFRVRARFRREKLLQSIHQRQVDELYAKLHANFVVRERRRLAAIAIQRIYKGFATRMLVAKWKAAANNLQRVIRGHRGRKRAIAFREGNLAFYMAERVFQRGVSISGRSVLLIIEKCGLSFRLEAYDMVTCSLYSGFSTHDSTMMLVRYENWSSAQGLCGQDVFLHGVHAVIDSVAFIDRAESQCVMSCRFLDGGSQQSTTGQRLISQVDCIQAINLRNVGTKGREAVLLPLPLTVADTTRIVTCLVERLSLVPTIQMATKELKKKSPGGFILTVLPPPKVHYIFNKTDTVKIETAMRSEALIQKPLLRLVAFPVVNGYRGVSVGKEQFRKKCARHSLHFTKCRCVLPFVKTPAYVEAITLALAPPPPPHDHT